MDKVKYFVSYFYKSEAEVFGFGRAELEVKIPVTIEEMEARIKEKNIGFIDVAILNFIKL